MDDPCTVGRRAFLKVGATAAAVTAAGCGAPPGRWRVLTEAEAATLTAVCDRIVPPDQDPGASQAGAVSFIDRQLATRQAERRELYGLGLKALEATAERRHGHAFAQLGSDAQVALLRDVEKGAVEAADWVGVEPAEFFGVVVDHTMMGFYGDPRHGGNRGRVSWKMLRLPDPPVRGRLHEPAPSATR